MSGFEIAGVVLGAIPILIEAVEFYRGFLRKYKTVIWKRHYIDKLVNALLLQHQMLEGIVESLLKASECQVPNDDSAIVAIQNVAIQARIEAFLGTRNSTAFCATLQQCKRIIDEVQESVLGLISGVNDSRKDLLKLIQASQQAPRRQFDITARLKLMFSMTETQELVQELDHTTSTLTNFTRIVLSNRERVQDTSSTEAIKLAEALYQVRNCANSLYVALCHGWRPNCHDKHEANLFLEDKVHTTVSSMNFKVGFPMNTNPVQLCWHETSVQVYKHQPQVNSISTNTTRAKIASAPSIASGDPRPIFVGDICGAITDNISGQHLLALVITPNKQIGAVPTSMKLWCTHTEPSIETLESAVLSPTISRQNGPILALQRRMTLALTLSSTLLQLLQTEWLTKPWSKDNIRLLAQFHTNGNRPCTPQDRRVSLCRPFISLMFDPAAVNASTQTIEPKDALRELGILLMELWHEMTLETRFSLQQSPTNPHERLAYAIEWSNDTATNNPMLELYDKAVRHCLYGSGGGWSQHSDWEDVAFRGTVCADIINPLSKICKQWASLPSSVSAVK